MKNLILFIALYLTISCNVYSQEIPYSVSPDLFTGLDLYKNDRLTKNTFQESITASLADSNVQYVTSILWKHVKNVKVSGNYAYCIFMNGLVILDVSDKSNPTFVSQFYLGEENYPPYYEALQDNIFLSGNYVYIAYGEKGLQIINVSNPASPVLTGSYDTPGNAMGVAVSGNYAYVADWKSGLQIINVSNPASPALAGSYTQSYQYYQGVTVSGIYAYMYDGYYNYLRIINVSNPAAPALTGYYSSYCYGAVVSGNYAYLAAYSSGLQIINISNPVSPVLAGSYDTPGNATGVTINGNYAYVADGSRGLQVINISDPTSPLIAGSCRTSGDANRITVSGSYAYVAEGDSGLQIINVSNPGLPVVTGIYRTPGYVPNVTVSGNYAYVADMYSGLQIINVSSPSSPVLAGNYYYNTYYYSYYYYSWGFPHKVVASGNYAYVADYQNGLKIINVSNPATPVLAGKYSSVYSNYGLAVNGNYTYVADGSLKIINVSDPSAPALAGTYSSSYGYDVMVSGSYAYLVDGSYGFKIINVSTPSAPVLTGSYDTPGSATGIALSGNYAYVIEKDNRELLVLNVTTPSAPVLTGSYRTPQNTPVNGIAVNGNYAYIALGDSGLLVLNVSNPASPSFAGRYKTPGYANGVFVSGNYVYVADKYSLMVLSFSSSGVVNNSPVASFTITPTSGTTSTTFAVDASGSSDLQDAVSALQVRWDWENDGTWDTQYSTTKTTTHQYNSVGTYFVKLEVKDTGGLSATTTKQCTVSTGGGTGGGHFRVAYESTGNNATVLVQTATTVTVNNNPFTLSSGDEIAIYTPSADTICCGVGIWNGSNIAIAVWGDNDQTTTIKEGFTAGQNYAFRLWDTSESKEYSNAQATFSSGQSTYTANAISIVSVLNFTTFVELSLHLPSGWNMVSSNVIPQFTRMDSVFQNIVSKVVIAKNGLGKVYWPQYTINQIGGWNILEGYLVYMSASDTLKIRGQRATPSTPLSLPAGWSMIAYLPTIAMSPATACSSIADKIVIVKDALGKVYWPQYGINQIGTMQAGKGYQIYLSGAGTLIYPSTRASKEGFNLTDGRNQRQMSPQHFSLVRGTGSNATILMKMNEKPVINGTILEIGDEIGVYTPEGICAGAGVWNGDDIVITVWGDNGETMNIDGFVDGQAYSFRLWHKSANSEKDISVIAQSGNLMYSENGITIISYEKSGALPDNFVLRQNYPNPFNPSTRIEYQIKTQSEVTLAIYNTAGQLIRMLVQNSQPAGVYSIEWDGRNSSGVQVPSGIYLYRLQAGSVVETRKMVMMK